MHHSRSLKTTLSICVLAVAMAGCANPADDKPTAVVGTATPETRAAGAEGRIFTIGPDSTIGFVGSKVTGKHDGGFKSFTGKIEMVDGDATRSTVRVEIDTTSLWADNDRLTGHLKSPDFFGVEAHPTATFVSTKIVRAANGYTITGNLDLHGVTKSITFPAEISVGADRVTARAEFVLKRFDFGIVYPGKADDLIRDEVVVRLDLVGLPRPAAA